MLSGAPLLMPAFKWWTNRLEGTRSAQQRSTDRCAELLSGRCFQDKRGSHSLRFELKQRVRDLSPDDGRGFRADGLRPEYKVKTVVFAEAQFSHQQRGSTGKTGFSLLKIVANGYSESEFRKCGNKEQRIGERRLDYERCGSHALGL
jgi:hypothetical protein